MKQPEIRPFLKWAGGKRALLPEILPRVPIFNGRYVEPFLGAGAVLFAMPAEAKKISNDFNLDLIEVYEMIRDFRDELLNELGRHKNTKELLSGKKSLLLFELCRRRSSTSHHLD